MMMMMMMTLMTVGNDGLKVDSRRWDYANARFTYNYFMRTIKPTA